MVNTNFHSSRALINGALGLSHPDQLPETTVCRISNFLRSDLDPRSETTATDSVPNNVDRELDQLSPQANSATPFSREGIGSQANVNLDTQSRKWHTSSLDS